MESLPANLSLERDARFTRAPKLCVSAFGWYNMIDEEKLFELPVQSMLQKLGVELDQRLQQAWETACKLTRHYHGTDPFLDDDELVFALLKLNPRCSKFFDFDTFSDAFKSVCGEGKYPNPPDETYGGLHVQVAFYELARTLKNHRTITTAAYMNWIVKESLNTTMAQRPGTADLIAHIVKGHYNAQIDTVGANYFLKGLSRIARADDDFQYLIALDGDRMAFRVVSVLDDFYQPTDQGVYAPTRALMTHFGRIGIFTQGEIEELENLINFNAREDAFQNFFEAHPHFFRRWDYRSVHPQVYLTREKDYPLVPDFILTDSELQKATILDLKRPNPKLIRHQRNRDRFAAAVMEARAQLLTYRRYFEETSNRQKARHILGMEIYHPHLAVVIGRSTEFVSSLQRQRLISDTSDIEVVTYDDILTYAKRRRAIIES